MDLKVFWKCDKSRSSNCYARNIYNCYKTYNNKTNDLKSSTVTYCTQYCTSICFNVVVYATFLFHFTWKWNATRLIFELLRIIFIRYVTAIIRVSYVHDLALIDIKFRLPIPYWHGNCWAYIFRFLLCTLHLINTEKSVHCHSTQQLPRAIIERVTVWTTTRLIKELATTVATNSPGELLFASVHTWRANAMRFITRRTTAQQQVLASYCP